MHCHWFDVGSRILGISYYCLSCRNVGGAIGCTNEEKQKVCRNSLGCVLVGCKIPNIGQADDLWYICRPNGTSNHAAGRIRFTLLRPAGDTFCQATRANFKTFQFGQGRGGSEILTAGIYCIFRGLKFPTNTEIGRNMTF